MGARLRNWVTSITLLVLIFSAQPAMAIMYGTEDLNASVNNPWVVQIWEADSVATYSDPSFKCSGSLIQNDVVLTAAHCVDSNGFLFVKYGSDSLNDATPFIPVDAVWKHPRYSNTSQHTLNDVGLVKLEKPVDGAVVVRMATASMAKAVATAGSYKALGWGIDQNGDDATYLRWAKLDNQDVVAASRLKKYGFSKVTQIAAGHYIAKEKVYQADCYGDSGGPLTIVRGSEVFVVGVMSWVLGTKTSCDTSTPSVFARVSYYAGEIQTAVSTLMQNAIINNRSIPKALSTATISGSPVVGSTLTCNPGTWSQNTISVSTSWHGSYGQTLATGKQIKIGTDLESKELTCDVVGANRNASVTSSVKVTVLTRPKSTGYLAIAGVGSTAPPTGSQITCGGLSWGSGSTEKIDWYVSDTVVFDYASAKLLGTGSPLVLTSTARKSLLGKWLTCVSTGTSAAGSAAIYTNVYFPSGYAPTAWAYASYTGSDLSGSKTYKCVNQSGFINGAVNVAFKWGVSDYATYQDMGSEIASGSVLTLDAATRKSYNGKTLTCKVTVSNEDGSADSYSSLYLSLYSN